jgi:hypothetical protein
MYIETGNASEAYRQSYDAAGMAPESIGIEASRLLDDPNITLKIESLRTSPQAARHHS